MTPIRTATNTADKWITVGRYPRAIAIMQNGKTAYVANGGSDTVTPINTATGTTRKAIKVGNGPHAIAITPNGKTAYVVNDIGGVPRSGPRPAPPARRSRFSPTSASSRSRRNDPAAGSAPKGGWPRPHRKPRDATSTVPSDWQERILRCAHVSRALYVPPRRQVLPVIQGERGSVIAGERVSTSRCPSLRAVGTVNTCCRSAANR